MGVNRMLVQNEDSLATLRDLLSVRKEDVIEAHEELRKQITLTDGEKKKADEARNYIVKYNELKADIDEQQSELDAKELTFAARVSEFNDNSLSESARLADWEKDLIQKQKNIDSANAENKAAAKKMEDDRRFMASSYDASNAKLQADIASVEAQRQYNESEKARLASLAFELKAKAQKQLDSF